MKIVVTGRSELADRVISLFRGSGHEVAVSSTPFDDRSVRGMTEALTSETALVHFVGWTSPPLEHPEQLAFVEEAIFATLRVLDAARKSIGGPRVVMFVSCVEPPRDAETSPDRPGCADLFEVVRLAAEDHLRSFSAEEEIHAVAVRLPTDASDADIATLVGPFLSGE